MSRHSGQPPSRAARPTGWWPSGRRLPVAGCAHYVDKLARLAATDWMIMQLITVGAAAMAGIATADIAEGLAYIARAAR